MKRYFSGFSLLISTLTFSQKGIDGMVQAERNFAAFALASGTKDAFIQFADSTGVVFEKGQSINARYFGLKEKNGQAY